MTTVHPDAGIVWFAWLGFRPAVWTPPHRHDEVDPPRLVPSPDADEPLLAANPRTRLQVRALERLDADERAVIRREADAWREAAVHRSRPPARTA